jgi:TRAP transporter TAXI family solute receptor
LGKSPGAPANDVARQKLLAAYGMTDNDIILLSGNNIQNLAQQLREGVGDAAIVFGTVGDLSIVELCTTKDCRFISLPLDKMDFAEDLWMTKGKIPAGTYRGQDKDVSCLRSPNSIAVRVDMDTDLAYAIIKVAYDHWDEFAAVSPEIKDYAITETLKSWFLPFHPGAIKYYKEKGIWTSEMDGTQQRLMNKTLAIPPAKPQ